MCSLAYQLTYTSPIESPFEYFFYCIYIVCIVTQIFLPCFFGNEVIFTGSSLSNCAYSSEWYSFSLNYRKVLFVFLERLKRKSEIMAGKLFNLSLDTFTSIVHFSYRLYTVIGSR
ncbi:odorant receptor 94b-like [Bradysia coprophila]|uniref:odorant receptor 94b-like n=1 Tax=Bradysia coprophila TaxID=38358 RepID=UPI00187DCF5F|nr:odorant receptor 94b-like [Bradysia coprophila]